MAGCSENFQLSAAQVDAIAVVFVRGDLPRPRRIGLRVESPGQITTDLSRRDFSLGRGARPLSVGASEVGVRGKNCFELPVTATWSACVCEFRITIVSLVNSDVTCWMLPIPMPVSKSRACVWPVIR